MEGKRSLTIFHIFHYKWPQCLGKCSVRKARGCTRVISPFASENIIIQGRFFKEETWSQPFFHIFIYLSQENLGNCPVKKIRVRKSATSVLLFKKILFHSLYFQQVKYVPVMSDIFTNIFSAVRDFIVYSTDLTPFLSNSVCSAPSGCEFPRFQHSVFSISRDHHFRL